MAVHSPVDDALAIDSTLDRIIDTRRRNAELRQPRRSDILRPDGPNQRDAWLSVMRGDAASVAFIEQFAGYRPVAYVRMPRGDLYVLNDPDIIWDVFVSGDVMKGFGLQQVRAAAGDGILTSEGDKHRRHRAMLQPAFTGRRIAGYSQDMVAAALALDERWTAQYQAGDTSVQLLPEMTRLTLDILGRTIFGLDLAAMSDRIGPPLAEALEMFMVAMGPSWEILSRFPSRTRRRLTRAVDELDEIVADMIVRKRAAVAAGNPGDDMLTALITATDPETGRALTDNEVRDEAMTLLTAGHETTTMLLTWTWLLLFQHPTWKAWVTQEWDACPEGPASMADLPRTRAVLAESMRLRPPAWVIDRFALTDTAVGDYVVPQGEALLASQYLMHRDPRFWPEPDRFRPDRWLDAAGDFTDKIVPRGVYFPFGFAARKCIGDRFALTEAALALLHLGRRWHVIPLDPSRIEPRASVTLRPSTPVPARLRRR